MTIKSTYFDLLQHLGSTVTLRELSRGDQPDAIALRHDVDHDLDLALEMAHHEHERGFRSTYFLLHTCDYWSEEQFALKCRQLAAYGHEVALHLNVISEWMRGDVVSIDQRLAELLRHLRDSGVEVTGVSAHGDRLCYEHGFINYWIWQELRGEDPARTERGLSAEGVPVSDPQWQVPYPSSHTLARSDGAQLPLWRFSMQRNGLLYDAVHLPVDRYWTDSGGAWSRSGDPLHADLRRGRHQVLVHPFWWRGPSRMFFVLSTARSGSKWLANFIDRATSARGLHEWTLNHRRTGDGFVADKRTQDDYAGLLEDRQEASSLVRDAINHHRTEPGETVEANVYLEPFLPELRSIAPDATIILLHRNGRDVVRSLLDRDWYDTPGDRRHRPVPVPQWDQLSQFQRACWYWSYTNESIMPYATRRLAFEQMNTDRAYLQHVLAGLGIVVHPLLADIEFPRRINASAERRFSSYDDWSSEDRRVFERICGRMQRSLGYQSESVARGDPAGGRPVEAPAEALARGLEGATMLLQASGAELATTLSAVHVHCEVQGDRLQVSARQEERSDAHLLLANGNWRIVQAEHGIRCDRSCWYRCRVRASLDPQEMRVRAFVLFFDAGGQQIRALKAATLRGETVECVFSFAAAAGASHFALALHFGKQAPVHRLSLQSISLEALPMDGRYRAFPHAAPQAVEPGGRASL